MCDRFLSEHPEFSAVRVFPDMPRYGEGDKYLTLMPHIHSTDGFFIAVFQKDGGKKMSKDIMSMTYGELAEVFSGKGLPGFRAKQVYQWLHCRLAASYDEMTDLPKALREQLAEEYPLNICTVAKKAGVGSGRDCEIPFTLSMTATISRAS